MDPTNEVTEITPEEMLVKPPVPENKKLWFQQNYWKEKGEPVERKVLTIEDRNIEVVNYNKDIAFGDFEDRAKKAVGDFAEKFPDSVMDLKWILIRDFQPPPVHEEFPANGQTLKGTPEGTMVLEPRAFEDIIHRVGNVANLEGTIAHELGHQVEESIVGDWLKFWPQTFDDPGNWIKVEGYTFPVHKDTGQRSVPPEGRFMADLGQAVTDYAKISTNEDICESIVAYMYNPDILRAVSRDKFNILQSHDQNFQAVA